MNRMYEDFAHLWPLISHHSDYEEEAVHWRSALTDELGQGRLRILELGVGGGNNLHHILYPECDGRISADAACNGEHMLHDHPAHDAVVVDPSHKMLANCKLLNPTVTQYIGDMRSVRLNDTFDAMLIHDAVCYLTSEDDINATLATARAHLRQDGVLIMAPDWYTETYPGTKLDAGIRRDVTPEFASIEYDHDPGPARQHSGVCLHLHHQEHRRQRQSGRRPPHYRDLLHPYLAQPYAAGRIPSEAAALSRA